MELDRNAPSALLSALGALRGDRPAAQFVNPGGAFRSAPGVSF